MFPSREHLSDEGPCSTSWDPFMSLVSISLLDIIHSNWGFGLRCLHISIFIETPSLEGLLTKAKEDSSPHEMRLSPLDINPIFPALGETIIIIFIIIIIIIIIIVIIVIIIVIIFIITLIIIITLKRHFSCDFLIPAENGSSNFKGQLKR